MTEVKKDAFRTHLMFLSGLADALGRTPEIEKPQVTFFPGSGTTTVYWAMWGTEDWNLTEEDRKRDKREKLEAAFAAIVDLFPGAEWEKNEPTGIYGENYYELKGTFENVTIEIVTQRKDVCERVVVLEHDVVEEVPDPEILKSVPLVKKTIQKQVVEWQCNTALAEKTAPRLTTKKAVSV